MEGFKVPLYIHMCQMSNAEMEKGRMMVRVT